jgi:putative transposase
VDNVGEIAGRAIGTRAYPHHEKLYLIRPGKPVKNGFILSFIGKLRDECLDSEVFLSRRP